MRSLNLLSLMAVVGITCGCATLRSEHQKVTFNTDPQGATLIVGEKEYITPAEVELKRKEQHQVVVRKEGFRTMKFTLAAQWDGASLVDAALPGGSIWFSTSAARGTDRSFRRLATIRLRPSSSPDEPPLEMICYKGGVFTEEEYKKVLEEERRYWQYYFE